VRRSSLTSVPPLALLLLGGEPPVLQPNTDANGGKGLIVASAVCPALRFRLPSAKAALLLEELRSAWLCMVDVAMAEPQRVAGSERAQALVSAVTELVSWSASAA